MTGQIGPAFQWPILNYGRLLNNVRYQDYKTQELVAAYQQKVLTAAQEVEGGIVTFLNARRESVKLAASAKAAERAVKLTTDQLNAGAIDFTAVFVASQFLAQLQNQYAQSQGDIALGLITTYRALGGGWEIREADPSAAVVAISSGPNTRVTLGTPQASAGGAVISPTTQLSFVLSVCPSMKKEAFDNEPPCRELCSFPLFRVRSLGLAIQVCNEAASQRPGSIIQKS